MNLSRTKILETSLVLTTGFLVVYFITSNVIFLYISVGFGVTGIFIKPLAKIIAIAWFKLADILNYIVSKIVLGIMFFFILFPISIFYRLLNKNKMKIKRSVKTNWQVKNNTYSAEDLENIW